MTMRMSVTPTTTLTMAALLRTAGCAVFCLVTGCASTRAGSPPPAGGAPAAAPPVEYEMEPIKIEAVKGPTGVSLESYDAAELFERAGAALSDRRFDEAIPLYTKL